MCVFEAGIDYDRLQPENLFDSIRPCFTSMFLVLSVALFEHCFDLGCRSFSWKRGLSTPSPSYIQEQLLAIIQEALFRIIYRFDFPKSMKVNTCRLNPHFQCSKATTASEARSRLKFYRDRCAQELRVCAEASFLFVSSS
jgi:hypothetical protein